jgi:hypothetical protein
MFHIIAKKFKVMDKVGHLFGLTGDNVDDTLTPYNRDATEDTGGEDNGVAVTAADTAGKEWTLTGGGRGHGHAGTKPGPTSKPEIPPNNHNCPTPATTAPGRLNGIFLWHRPCPQAARAHDV